MSNTILFNHWTPENIKKFNRQNKYGLKLVTDCKCEPLDPRTIMHRDEDGNFCHCYPCMCRPKDENFPWRSSGNFYAWEYIDHMKDFKNVDFNFSFGSKTLGLPDLYKSFKYNLFFPEEYLSQIDNGWSLISYENRINSPSESFIQTMKKFFSCLKCPESKPDKRKPQQAHLTITEKLSDDETAMFLYFLSTPFDKNILYSVHRIVSPQRDFSRINFDDLQFQNPREELYNFQSYGLSGCDQHIFRENIRALELRMNKITIYKDIFKSFLFWMRSHGKGKICEAFSIYQIFALTLRFLSD